MAAPIQPDITVGVKAHSIEDIHRAYFSTLTGALHAKASTAEVVLDHHEEPNVVRSYHEQFTHGGVNESQRGTGGGSYYHTRSDDEGIATRCVNLVETMQDTQARFRQQRHRFGETMLQKLEDQTRLSRSDLHYDFDVSPDIHVIDDEGRRKQVVGASMRHFRFDQTAYEVDDAAAYLYRACVQRRGIFEPSVDDSAWLLQRDNVNPEAYKNHVRPVPRTFAEPRTYQDISELQGHYHAVDALAWRARGHQTGPVKPSFLAAPPLRSARKPWEGRPPTPCVPVSRSPTPQAYDSTRR